MTLWFEDISLKRAMPHSSKCYLSTSCLWIYNLAVLSYLGRCKFIVFLLFFFFFFFFLIVFWHTSLFLNEKSARYSPFMFVKLCKQNLSLSLLPIWAFMSQLKFKMLFGNISDDSYWRWCCPFHHWQGWDWGKWQSLFRVYH